MRVSSIPETRMSSSNLCKEFLEKFETTFHKRLFLGSNSLTGWEILGAMVPTWKPPKHVFVHQNIILKPPARPKNPIHCFDSNVATDSEILKLKDRLALCQISKNKKIKNLEQAN